MCFVIILCLSPRGHNVLYLHEYQFKNVRYDTESLLYHSQYLKSTTSERCWIAGWIMSLTYALWHKSRQVFSDNNGMMTFFQSGKINTLNKPPEKIFLGLQQKHTQSVVCRTLCKQTDSGLCSCTWGHNYYTHTNSFTQVFIPVAMRQCYSVELLSW